MSDESLSQFLQEGLLTLLCFDDEKSRIIRNSVELNLWEGDYKTIADVVYKYLDRSRRKRAPKEHVADLLEEILHGKDKRRARRFRDILRSARETSKTIDADFTMGRLTTFVRRQKTISSIMEAGELIQSGTVDEETLDRVEGILSDAAKHKLALFDPGTHLGDPKKSLSYLIDQDDREIFRTGIKELDDRRLGPIRRGLHLLIGPFKMGKSWWLTTLGKHAALDGHKVLHITLEMDEEQVARRYHQAFLALAKRRKNREFKRVNFKMNKDGRLEGVRIRQFTPKHSLDDDGIGIFLEEKLKRRLGRQMDRIIVKQFPTSQLTIAGLDAYMDNLEYQYGFVPDLLLIDYPGLMKIDPRNFRVEHGQVVKAIRGIGGSRNMAVATVAQSNRAGLEDRNQERSNRRRINAKRVGISNAAEDISQIGTADTILTFSQTPEEHILGLARLYVAAARDEEDQFSVLISQNYATGQFCRASVRMQKQYWSILEDLARDEDLDDEDDEDADEL